jgi:hypothetical protein
MSNVVAMNRTTDQLSQLADAIKDWVAANIKLSYDESRKLAVAGKSDDPAKAIADMREGNRIRKQASAEDLENWTEEQADKSKRRRKAS